MMSSNDADPPSETNFTLSVEHSNMKDAENPEVQYLSGWRFTAVGIAIVLSMFLVCPG